MAAPGLTPAQVSQCPPNTQAVLLPSKRKWLVVLGLAEHNVPFPNQRRSGACSHPQCREDKSKAATTTFTEYCSIEHSRLALTSLHTLQ